MASSSAASAAARASFAAFAALRLRARWRLSFRSAVAAVTEPFVSYFVEGGRLAESLLNLLIAVLAALWVIPSVYVPDEWVRFANLVRVLSRQTDELVGLVEHKCVRQGADTVADAFQTLKKGGHRYAIVDALDDADLGVIGRAIADHPLVTGGSGIALGLPENYRRQGLLGAAAKADLPNVAGPAVIIAGSCSQATRGQVARARKLWPHHKVDPMSLGDVADAAGFAAAALAKLGATCVALALAAKARRSRVGRSM